MHLPYVIFMYAFMFWEVSSKRLAASSDSPSTSSTHISRKKEGLMGCLVGMLLPAGQQPKGIHCFFHSSL